MNIKTVPAIMGTDVRLTIWTGFFLTEPATISTTAETGDTARNRLPARPIGMLTASTLIPGGGRQRHHQGHHGEEERGAASAEDNDESGESDQESGRTKPRPPPWMPSIAFCNASEKAVVSSR